MALSIAELIIFGLIADWLFRKFKIPGLVGMLLLGVIAGPYVLNSLNPDLIAVSSDLRMIALIVILLRAGFELSKETLHKVGLLAIWLSFVPAVFEGAAVAVLGHFLLGLTYMESAILGAVLSAVSPAVVVPLMIQFIERKKGRRKGIPTLILAASSIDDVFVIVVYSVLIGMYTGQSMNIASKLAGIPISILSGILVGLISGFVLYKFFERYNPRATKRLLVILGISIILVNVEHVMENIVPFAALLAVMAIGFIILEKSEYMAHEISAKLNKLWVFAAIILFTLVGAQVNLGVVFQTGLVGALLICLALVARSIGTYLCLLGSNLNISERMFVVISYIPKATVQAAIGGAPLVAMKLAGMNTRPGEIILAVAVLSILLTAPLGAWAISVVGNRVLAVDAQAAERRPKGIGAWDITGADVVSSLKVSEVMEKDIVVIREKEKLSKILDFFSIYDFLVYPVVDSKNKFIGIIRLENLRSILKEQSCWDLLVAKDVVVSPEENIVPALSLNEALSRMLRMGIEQIPVIEERSMKPVGILDARKGRKIMEERLIARDSDKHSVRNEEPQEA